MPYRIVDDMVQLRGLIRTNTPSVWTIADLPVGYRPPKSVMFNVAVGEPNALGRLDIYNDGQIHSISQPTTWVNLGNIRFSTRA